MATNQAAQIAEDAATLLLVAAERAEGAAKQIVIDASVRLGELASALNRGAITPEQAVDFARKVPVTMAARLATLARKETRSYIGSVIELVIGGLVAALAKL